MRAPRLIRVGIIAFFALMSSGGMAADTPPPAAAGPPLPVPVRAGKGFLVHVASLRTEEGALREWARLEAKTPSLFKGLSPTLVTTKVGEKGVFFRLYAGMLADEAAAKALCAALRPGGDYCGIVKN